MQWIGITGGIATGKSTVTKILLEKGYPVADADEFAKQALAVGSPGLQQVLQYFGPEILLPDGSLDRKKLAERIFKIESEKQILEKIVHPLVQEKVAQFRKQAERQQHKIAFYDVPLLFEKNLASQFDHILLVIASEKQQVERLQKRNSLSAEQAKVRILNQFPQAQKIQQADFIIDNQGELSDLKSQVEKFLKSIGA